MNTEPIQGFLILDKPLGLSSMKALARVRVLARDTSQGGKGGHAGTLDPLATGVLVIGFGRPATRQLARIMGASKRYLTTVDLSAFSPSDDLEHEPEPVEIEKIPDAETVQAAITGFKGEIMQAPPTFSAIKVDGKRAYQLARKDKIKSLDARPVIVHDIHMVEYQWPTVTIDVHCGKGFYVRSLARDLGAALGTGGFCRSIHRTAVGPFGITDATAFKDLPDSIQQKDLVSIEDALGMLED